MSLSWKAKRNGDRYCAPVCGGGCTKQQYDVAVATAKSTIRQLKGKAWKFLVYENLGWHWKVVSGPVQIYPSSDKTGRFWCMIGDTPKDCAGGAAFWTPGVKYFKDPNRAVRYALSYAQSYYDQLTETIEAAKQATASKGAN